MLLLCWLRYFWVYTANTELQSKLKKDLFNSLNKRLGKLSIIPCYACFEVEATWNKTNLENCSVFEKMFFF